MLINFTMKIENMFQLLTQESLTDPNQTILPLMMLMTRNFSQLSMESHLLVRYGQMMQHSQISSNLRLWSGSNQTWTRYTKKWLSMVSGKIWTKHPISAKEHATENKLSNTQLSIISNTHQLVEILNLNQCHSTQLILMVYYNSMHITTTALKKWRQLMNGSKLTTRELLSLREVHLLVWVNTHQDGWEITSLRRDSWDTQYQELWWWISLVLHSLAQMFADLLVIPILNYAQDGTSLVLTTHSQEIITTGAKSLKNHGLGKMMNMRQERNTLIYSEKPLSWSIHL